jgi:hypothetical protein
MFAHRSALDKSAPGSIKIGAMGDQLDARPESVKA